MTAPTSLYIDVAGRAWEERRPGVFWKVLWEEADRKAVLMRYTAGATIARHRHTGDPAASTPCARHRTLP